MRIRTLDTIDEVRALDGLLGEYCRFVCGDLKRAYGLSFDANVLLEAALNSLPKVIPPNGYTFVAETDEGDLLGMVFLRRSGSDAMEIKRLFVVPEGRGTGAGRSLVMQAMKAAKEAGASALRLDTARNLTAAIALYESFGFTYCEPYPESEHFEDEVLAPYLVFMVKDLRTDDI